MTVRLSLCATVFEIEYGCLPLHTRSSCSVRGLMYYVAVRYNQYKCACVSDLYFIRVSSKLKFSQCASPLFPYIDIYKCLWVGFASRQNFSGSMSYIYVPLHIIQILVFSLKNSPYISVECLIRCSFQVFHTKMLCLLNIFSWISEYWWFAVFCGNWTLAILIKMNLE